MLLVALCGHCKVDCHVANLRATGIPRGWDGVRSSGYQLLADRIWRLKLDNEIPI